MKKRIITVIVIPAVLATILLLGSLPATGSPMVDWQQGSVSIGATYGGKGSLYPDGLGGVFIERTINDQYIQVINKKLPDGSDAPGWENGIEVPANSYLARDGSGGVWLLDTRDWTKIVLVRHYLADGTVDTSIQEGRVLVEDEHLIASGQLKDNILVDPYGDFYLVWEVSGREISSPVRCLKFDGNWNVSPGWPSEGVEMGDDAILSGFASDEMGGLLVVWHNEGYDYNVSIYAQRVDGDGRTHEGWPAGGRMLFKNIGGRDGIHGVGATGDGEGGLFIHWTKWDAGGQDFPERFDLFASKMDASGKVTWLKDISGYVSHVFAVVTADGFGGAFIYHSVTQLSGEDFEGTNHIDRDGNAYPGWRGTMLRDSVFEDGEGGAYNLGLGGWLRVDAQGNPCPGWPEGGAKIADLPANFTPSGVVRVADRSFVVSWVDETTTPNTLYAQRVTDVLPPPNFDTYLLVENPGVEEAEVTFTFMLENGMTKKVLKLIVPHSRYTLKVNDYVPFRSVSTEITSNKPVIAERAMYFDYLSTYKGGHSCSGVPEAAKTWYLAEGYTGGSFDTYLLLQNPTDSPASTTVTYMLPGGATREQSLELSPHSRTTINVDTLPELSSTELSIKVDSSSDVIAERAMYFDYYSRTGGHEQAGTTAPARTYHLPEGYCGESFDTYILTQNPGDTPTEVTYTFMKEGGGTVERKEIVPPHSRYTLKVDDVEGLSSAQFSTSVTSSEPVVVERAVYFDYKGQNGGHDAMGAVSPSREWYLAEGYTAGSFDTYVLLENPNEEKATVRATYMLPSGHTIEEDYVLNPLSRKTVKLDDVQGLSDTEVSTKLTTDEDTPIVAERAVYFSYGSGWDGGHDTMAVPVPSTTWCFAEGYTGY